MGVLDSFFAGFDRGTNLAQTDQENRQRRTQLDLNERGMQVQERAQERLGEAQELINLGNDLKNRSMLFSLRQQELQSKLEADNRVRRAEGLSSAASRFEALLGEGRDSRQAMIESVLPELPNILAGQEENTARLFQSLPFTTSGGSSTSGSFGSQRKPLSPMEEQRGITMLDESMKEARAGNLDSAKAKLAAVRRFAPETGFSDAGNKLAAEIYAEESGLKNRQLVLDQKVKDLTEERNKMSRSADVVIRSQFRGGHFVANSSRSINPVLNKVSALTSELEAAKAERAELQKQIDKPVLIEGFQTQLNQGLIDESQYLEKLKLMFDRELLSFEEFERLARALITDGNS